MLSRRTLKFLVQVLRILCAFSSVPYSACSKYGNFKLTATISMSLLKSINDKIVCAATFLHTIFITIRLIQACLSQTQKNFVLFFHFSWCISYLLFSALHLNILVRHFSVKAYFNGLFKFFSSTTSMPGARHSGKIYLNPDINC